MNARVFNVLFLCTGNSARSILAEALLNHWGAGRLRSGSWGSRPSTCAARAGTSSQRPVAPVVDFVFTVCDQAAGEVCPVWPGQPITAHWGLPDPAIFEDPVEQSLAFRETFRALENRIKIFVALPIAALDRMSLTCRVEAIGRMRPDAAEGQAS